MQRKLVILGIDAMQPEYTLKLINEGKLPNIAKLAKEGVFTKVWPTLPALTSTNWTSIATGAWPSNHQITCQTLHFKGEQLNKLHDAFISNYRKADSIWEAAERQGKKVILMGYPASWPPTIKNGIQIDGHGVPWRASNMLEISPSRFISTIPGMKTTRIELRKAAGWKNLPAKAKNFLETTLTILPQKEKDRYFGLDKWRKPHKEKNLHILIFESGDKGYDTVYLCKSKDVKSKLAEVKLGKWSNWIIEDFEYEDGNLKGAFHVKLQELSSDGKRFSMYVSQVFPTELFTYPKEIASELVKNVGPYIEHPGWGEMLYGWLSEDDFLEEVDRQNQWFAHAASYLFENHDWDIFMMQAHCLDWAQHTFWKDPFWNDFEPRKRRFYEDLLIRAYQSIDKMVGTIMAKLDDKTVITLVSDHGMISYNKEINLGKALNKAGLLNYRIDKSTNTWVVDWSRTKAYPQRSIYIYINVKGREPEGIVEPGVEYKRVQEEVIKTLYSIVDPETGRCPITMALKKEDARILGIGGERVGDVIYTIEAGYSAKGAAREGAAIEHEKLFGKIPSSKSEHDDENDDENIVSPKIGEPAATHGQHLPTAKLGLGTCAGVLILSGPGIKKNERINPVWMVDILPTLCHLLEIDPPQHCQGRIITEALIDPYECRKKLQEVIQERDKLSRLIDGYHQAVTHF